MLAFHIVLLIASVTVVTSNIFTSTHKLHRLAQNEGRVLSSLETYIQQENHRLQNLSQQFLELRKYFQERQMTQTKDDLDHPNGMYHVIKRFVWQYCQRLGKSQDLFQNMLDEEPEPIVLAIEEDFYGAIRALLRLQDYYNLTTSDMANGEYKGYLGPSLGCEDAYKIGFIAFKDGNPNTSAEWLQKALELRTQKPASREEPQDLPPRGHIQVLLGRVFVLLYVTQEYPTVRPFFPDKPLFLGTPCVTAALKEIDKAKEMLTLALTDDSTDKTDIIDLETDLENPPELTPDSEYILTFQANHRRLCQYQEPYVIEKPDYKAMKCRYKPGLLPYYVFREEILSTSPYVSLFYNVVTEEERGLVTEKASSSLRTGRVTSEDEYENQSENTDDTKTYFYRTSDVAWLSDAEGGLGVSRVSQRISLITGLSVEQKDGSRQSSELLQVANYGLGGHFRGHIDPLDEDESGYRMATFLIYLNNVQEGGNTVFNNAGISVAPEKNTALFWYSFSPDLREADEMTEHAGCPVLIGEKWIANKWIRSYGNDYFRPCGLTPTTSHPELESLMAQRRRAFFHISDVK